MIVHFLSSFIISIVSNYIALDSILMKGILLIYIISMVSVTVCIKYYFGQSFYCGLPFYGSRILA